MNSDTPVEQAYAWAVENPLPGATAGAEPVYRCPYKDCRKVFGKRFNLKAHCRKHSGDRPFSCSYPGCVRRFMWKSSLTSHEAGHSRRNVESERRAAASQAQRQLYDQQQQYSAAQHHASVRHLAPPSHSSHPPQQGHPGTHMVSHPPPHHGSFAPRGYAPTTGPLPSYGEPYPDPRSRSAPPLPGPCDPYAAPAATSRPPHYASGPSPPPPHHGQQSSVPRPLSEREAPLSSVHHNPNELTRPHSYPSRAHHLTNGQHELPPRQHQGPPASHSSHPQQQESHPQMQFHPRFNTGTPQPSRGAPISRIPPTHSHAPPSRPQSLPHTRAHRTPAPVRHAMEMHPSHPSQQAAPAPPTAKQNLHGQSQRDPAPSRGHGPPQDIPARGTNTQSSDPSYHRSGTLPPPPPASLSGKLPVKSSRLELEAPSFFSNLEQKNGEGNTTPTLPPPNCHRLPSPSMLSPSSTVWGATHGWGSSDNERHSRRDMLPSMNTSGSSTSPLAGSTASSLGSPGVVTSPPPPPMLPEVEAAPVRRAHRRPPPRPLRAPAILPPLANVAPVAPPQHIDLSPFIIRDDDGGGPLPPMGGVNSDVSPMVTISPSEGAQGVFGCPPLPISPLLPFSAGVTGDSVMRDSPYAAPSSGSVRKQSAAW